MKIFFRNLLSFISILLTSAAILFVILTFLGYRLFILDSGSMEPLYKEGDFILANTHMKTENAKIGDVLIYRAENGALVMHRLVDADTFKGDANPTAEHVILSNANLIGGVSGSFNNSLFTFLINHSVVSQLLIIFFIVLACILPGSNVLNRR